MKHLLILVLIFYSCSGTETERKLEDKIITVRMQYIDWFCACANWADVRIVDTCNGCALPSKCVFIEAAEREKALPDTIGYSGDIVEFTGQFYTEPGYPKGYIEGEEKMEKAKIFRYSSYKIISSHYKDFKPEE